MFGDVPLAPVVLRPTLAGSRGWQIQARAAREGAPTPLEDYHAVPGGPQGVPGVSRTDGPFPAPIQAEPDLAGHGNEFSREQAGTLRDSLGQVGFPTFRRFNVVGKRRDF